MTLSVMEVLAMRTFADPTSSPPPLVGFEAILAPIALLRVISELEMSSSESYIAEMPPPPCCGTGV
jgi:hypothetical protein